MTRQPLGLHAVTHLPDGQDPLPLAWANWAVCYHLVTTEHITIPANIVGPTGINFPRSHTSDSTVLSTTPSTGTIVAHKPGVLFIDAGLEWTDATNAQGILSVQAGGGAFGGFTISPENRGIAGAYGSFGGMHFTSVAILTPSQVPVTGGTWNFQCTIDSTASTSQNTDVCFFRIGHMPLGPNSPGFST